MREEILLPAGVKQIGYALAGWQNKDLAVGYRADGQRWGSPLDHHGAADGPSWNLRGNGGMLSRAVELSQWYEALFDGKVSGRTALQTFLKNHAGQSRSVGDTVHGPAGSNGIFNAFQLSFVEAAFHLTFFTSFAGIQAEKKWADFRDEVFSLVKEPGAQ